MEYADGQAEEMPKVRLLVLGPKKKEKEEVSMATKTATKTATQTAISWEVIGPDEARKYLETVGVNRKVVQVHVERLAESMRGGEWVEMAGDPIRFNQQGELIDGQHRLWAVIEAGMPLRFAVARGLPVEAMTVLDTGRRRTLADFLEMHGEHNAAVMAGALGYLHYYWTTNEMVPIQWGVRKLTVPEALKLLEEHPGIRESVTVTHAVARLIGGGRSRWAAIHYVPSSIDYSDAEQFFKKLLTAEEVPQGSPISLLRNHLIADWHAMRHMGIREYIALVFKAWNLYRRGEPVKMLSWRGGGAYPEEYPIPK